MNNLETYGDLKKLIAGIQSRQKGQIIISKGKQFALDQVLGLIPGASNAKSAFEFFRVAISKPDTKKTNTWLDKLDIDDDSSKIIDDTVENSFMTAITKAIESESDEKPLEDSFDMNEKLVNFLRNTFSGRTITGIKESKMKKTHFKEYIKEEILKIMENQAVTPPARQMDSQVKDVIKYLQSPLIAGKLKSVNTRQEYIDLIAAINSAVDPKFQTSDINVKTVNQRLGIKE